MGLRFIKESVIGDIVNAVRLRAHENNEKKYTINGVISEISHLGTDLIGYFNTTLYPIMGQFKGGVFIPYSSLDMNNAYVNNNGTEFMFPVCGDNVTNLEHAFYNFINLQGAPVCGEKVTNLAYAYANCPFLSGVPVCGSNVTDMNNAYYLCEKLRGSPACGPNVINMQRAYFNCVNLTGSPACGPNVTNMTSTYFNCINLTGNPVCGPNVIDMSGAYYGCDNLTGSPVCGPNVINMSLTYFSCINLTGNPACGPNVNNMVNAYAGCWNLTGSPVCGPNVITMSRAYYDCHNLTGSPVCGPNVTTMSYTYANCTSLTGSPVCGPKVTSMDGTYYGCDNLTGPFAIGENAITISGGYALCNNLVGGTSNNNLVLVIPPNVFNMNGGFNTGFNQKNFKNLNNGTYDYTGLNTISDIVLQDKIFWIYPSSGSDNGCLYRHIIDRFNGALSGRCNAYNNITKPNQSYTNCFISVSSKVNIVLLHNTCGNMPDNYGGYYKYRNMLDHNYVDYWFNNLSYNVWPPTIISYAVNHDKQPDYCFISNASHIQAFLEHDYWINNVYGDFNDPNVLFVDINCGNTYRVFSMGCKDVGSTYYKWEIFTRVNVFDSVSVIKHLKNGDVIYE